MNAGTSRKVPQKEQPCLRALRVRSKVWLEYDARFVVSDGGL